MADALRAGKLSRKAQRLNGRLKMRQVLAQWLAKMALHRAQERKGQSVDARGNIYAGTEKIMNRRLSLGLSRWQAQVEKMKRRERMIDKVSKRLIGVRVAAAWSGWRDKHVHDKENRVKVARMVAKLKYKQVAGAIAAWTLMISTFKRHRQMFRQCVAKMTRKALLAGVEAFEQNAMTQRRRKVILQRSHAKLANRTLSAAFLGARGKTLAGSCELCTAPVLIVFVIYRNNAPRSNTEAQASQSSWADDESTAQSDHGAVDGIFGDASCADRAAALGIGQADKSRASPCPPGVGAADCGRGAGTECGRGRRSSQRRVAVTDGRSRPTWH